jgi:hypothetical protein
MSRVGAFLRRGWGGRARTGLPWLAVGLAIAATSIAILLQANDRPQNSSVYAEFSVRRDGCFLDPQRHRGIINCVLVGPRIVALSADRSLTHTTPFVSRGSCCPGTISASVYRDKVVVITFSKFRGTLRAAVFLP